MVRFGKTRYGHVFSKGKNGVGWVGQGSRRGRLAETLNAAPPAMPHVETRLPVRVDPELAPLRVWEVIENGVRVKISCDNCLHETIWTQGYMDKKLRRRRGQTISHMAQSLRCGGCRSDFVRVWRG